MSLRAKPGLRVDDLDTPEAKSSNDFWKGRAHVFVKADKLGGNRLILHEYLAARLANSVGVPVPFGEIANLGEGREAWVSGITTQDGKLLPPPDIVDVVRQERHVVAGIVVFDAWIFNPDRSEDNMVWSEDIGLWAIDHELAFCGSRDAGEDGNEWLKDNEVLPFLVANRKKLALTKEDVHPWVTLVAAQGAGMARQATESAHRRGLLTRETQGYYRRFLVKRAAEIRVLVGHGLEFSDDALPQITDENQPSLLT